MGSLGAAAVLAVVLSPVVDAALTGERFVATAIAVSYPLCDLLLVAAVAGIMTLRDLWSGNRWGLLFAGLALFSATDVVFAMQTSLDTYVVGTPLDAGWAIGLAFIAFWVDSAARPVNPTAILEARAAHRDRALVVPALSTAAPVVVLIMATREPLSTLVVTLAGVTLLAAVARTQIAFVQLAQMANLRRHEAITDPLTGLRNRRALSEDGDDGAARRQTVDELRTAIESGELVLHFQPKIDLHDGEVRGVEALVRWRHPTRGLLFPNTFIALVEEAGLMPAMTRVVLELALGQAAAWWAQGDRLTVAVAGGGGRVRPLVDRAPPPRAEHRAAAGPRLGAVDLT